MFEPYDNPAQWLCDYSFCQKVATQQRDSPTTEGVKEIYCDNHAKALEIEAESYPSREDMKDAEGDIKYHEEKGC